MFASASGKRLCDSHSQVLSIWLDNAVTAVVGPLLAEPVRSSCLISTTQVPRLKARAQAARDARALAAADAMQLSNCLLKQKEGK